MGKRMTEYVDELLANGVLEKTEFEDFLKFRNVETTGYLYEKARRLRSQILGDHVTVIGRIPLSNHCKNDCKMCGIRRDDRLVKRFRLSEEEVLSFCGEFQSQGVEMLLLESGDDTYLTEENVAELLLKIKKKFSRLTIFLSLGERNENVFRHWKAVGAEGYFFSHGSADDSFFKKIYPSNMSPLLKKQQLWNLKNLEYKVAAGFLVGMPYQTVDHVISDILFVKKYMPAYVNIGVFQPVPRSVFEKQRSGNGEMALYILAMLRLMLPNCHIIAEPTLDCALKDGRMKAFDAGADTLLIDIADLSLLNQYRVYERKNGRLALPADSLPSFMGQLSLRGFSI